jgi:hypothetical protein
VSRRVMSMVAGEPSVQAGPPPNTTTGGTARRSVAWHHNPLKWRRTDDVQFEWAPPEVKVHDRLTRPHPIQLDDFRFLQSTITRTAKVCIPSPSMMIRAGRREGNRSASMPTDRMRDQQAFFGIVCSGPSSSVKL